MTREMALIRYPGRISAQSHLRWDNGLLLVPPLCPHLNNLCGIIEVSYFLRLDYNEGNDFYMTDELAIPIVIGTIPLVNGSSITEYQQPMASSSLPPSAPPIWHSSSLPPKTNLTHRPAQIENNENTISTPTQPYNDLSKGEIIESDHKSFVPQYPFYNDPKATNQ